MDSNFDSKGPTRRHFLTVLSGAAAILLFPLRQSAHAWIPPGDFLLGRIADKRKNVRVVKVTGIRTYVGRRYEGGKQDVSETMWASRNGAYRIERNTPKGEYLEVSDGKQRVVVTDGKAGPIEPETRSLERALLVGAEQEDLIRAAADYGVRIEATGLGRVGQDVSWIVGASSSRDGATPQVWIDKDRSVPLRLVDPRSKRSVRYEGWREPAGSGVLPARVTWLSSGSVEQELKVESVKVNPKVPSGIFSPEAAVKAAATPSAKP